MNNSIHRRTFIRNTSLAAGAALALPSIASAVEILGKANRQKVKHVVYCILGGGVRNNETIGRKNGRLMPNLLHGADVIQPELGFEILQPVMAKPLSESAVLYTNFSYANGALTHFTASASALCGKYFEHPLDYRTLVTESSVFDYFGNSRILADKENKAVWIPNSLSKYHELRRNVKAFHIYP